MTDTTNLLNVIQVDDKNGNHYWICDVYHTTGADTDVLVPNSVISAAEIPPGASTAGTVTIENDDSATETVQAVVIDTGESTGLKKLIIRFSGSAAGMGSGHGVL
jgi:hypothetical protein